MAIKYYVATNTGRGFITHEDNETSLVAGFPGDVYATENTTWAARVGGVEKTLEDAQALVDTALSASIAELPSGSDTPTSIALPTGSL
jgi:hypothetical protein